jgi:hypothetical protein
MNEHQLAIFQKLDNYFKKHALEWIKEQEQSDRTKQGS